VLPPELTRARKRQGQLVLSPLSPAERARATALGERLLEATRSLIGREREDVEATFRAIEVAAKERKLLLGLTHLLEAHSEFSAPVGLEPELVRRQVFGLAARLRSELDPLEHLDRERVLAEVAAELSVSIEELEQALYADLRSAQRLERCTLNSARALVADYELSQVQSVLLRAVRIEAEVRAAHADAYRELFRKLKFRQLLFSVHPLEPSGYRLEIDGPLSLFGATTKYGLELSLSLPALLSCGNVRLKAELRWGKRREKLSFEQSFAALGSGEAAEQVRSEVSELQAALHEAGAWQVSLSDKLIDLTGRGGGVLVPDLELSRPRPGGGRDTLLVEILGFWSRDAVFRRIEAAERGLPQRVLFVVSSRLRVSEELLDGVESATLYVYKGKINVASLLRKAEAMFSASARSK
jgi:predicted nuclease of restriction endonuclease-like RecB superfamily